MKSKKLLVILGPTATGKTDLGIQLAKELQGEIVSCDSRQVYKGLNIGSGKYLGEENVIPRDKYWMINGVKLWMFDVADLSTQYNVADYIKDAEKVIEDIEQRGKLPIVVGGTGLYLKGLLEGLSNAAIPINEKLREELERLTLLQLQQKLKRLSLNKWENMNYSDRQNPRRLLRSIELASMNPYIDKDEVTNAKYLDCSILKIGLTAPREILYKRVDLNISKRLKIGMIEEVRNLLGQGVSFERLKQLGLEYGVLADFLNGDIKNESELEKVLQGKIHGYVRRQLTWFKKEKDVFWFDITSKTYLPEVEKLAYKWYYSSDAA